MDHIAVTITGSEKIQEILSQDSAAFREAVLCDALSFSAEGTAEAAKEWNINGEKATISIRRMK